MIKRLLTWVVLTAGWAAGATIHYSLAVPAVTTGVLQGPAFTMSFTLPDFMPGSGATSLTNEPTLVTSGWPNFSAALSASNNYLSIDFLANGGAVRGLFLANPATQHFDHAGTFTGDWQLFNPFGNTQGDIVSGTLTIVTTPEPAAAGLAGMGLAAVAYASFRRRAKRGERA